MVKEHGHFNMSTFYRLDVPVDAQKRLGIYRGHAKTYTEAKEKYLSIPKEMRKVPYISASRIIVLFPNDANDDEVLQALEFLVESLKKDIELSKKFPKMMKQSEGGSDGKSHNR